MQKAGFSILVTGDAPAEARVNFIKQLASVDCIKKTLLITGENRALKKHELGEIFKYMPDTVIYEELYGKDIFDILTVMAMGHQLLTTIAASNEAGALQKIIIHCSNRDKNFPAEILNDYLDLVIIFSKDRYTQRYKISSISVPQVENKNNVAVKTIIKYDLESRDWVQKHDIASLKEKVLIRTGETLKSWATR